MSEVQSKISTPSIIHLLGGYKLWIVAIFVATAAGSGLSLSLPWLVGTTIDRYSHQALNPTEIIIWFALIILAILVISSLSALLQALVAEKVAFNVRHQLNAAISHQSFQDLQHHDPAKLLTNITSDVEHLKGFVTFAVPSTISSIIMVVAASTLLISLNWRLGLAVLVIVPGIAITFAVIFGQAGSIFKQAQEVIDKLNRIINQTIVASSLIRVLNSHKAEIDTFFKANTESLTVGLRIVRLFSIIVPTVGLFANIASLIILVYGGHLIIAGDMSLGQIASFNGYIALLIWPIILLGIISTSTAEAAASWQRIAQLIQYQPITYNGTATPAMSGHIELKDVSLAYNDKPILSGVNLTIKAGSRTAIVGPTGAGKSQLLQLMAGLIPPTTGQILFDDIPLEQIDRQHFYRSLGLVFQDSSVFNVSLQQNIAFAEDVDPSAIKQAIDTAALQSLVEQLPQGVNTEVSERGTSLSGGQKQRLMLARALALQPTILLLDDFTARVDIATEQQIIASLAKNYPDLTLISISQKIDSIKDYDQIILLMEGELLASGTHQQLLKSSPEYVQIHTSQQSLS